MNQQFSDNKNTDQNHRQDNIGGQDDRQPIFEAPDDHEDAEKCKEIEVLPMKDGMIRMEDKIHTRDNENVNNHTSEKEIPLDDIRLNESTQ